MDSKVNTAIGANSPADPAQLPRKSLVEFYSKMLRIRMVEEAVAKHYGEGEMRCPVHLSIGQEAIAVGVCEALAPADKVYSTHRCHAHYLAKGGNLNRMLAEIYGKAAGCIGGRGGSMHLMDTECGLMASIPIVASSIPVAAGNALSEKRMHTGVVTVAFFGDASVEEGVFHESANFAMLHRLPIVFVCENNLFSVYTHLSQRQPDRPLTDLARAHNMPSIQGDGNNVEECFSIMRKAAERARGNGGPTFLVFDTYRWREHCGPSFDNHLGYRTEAEYEMWEKRCPISTLRARICGDMLSAKGESAIKADIAAEIEEAREFARSATLPEPGQASQHVYA